MKSYLVKLLSTLTLVLLISTVCVGNILVDSFPPFRIELNGVPGIFYSEADDKKIIITFEKQQYLLMELDACEGNLDSLGIGLTLCRQALNLTQSILKVEQRRLEGAKRAQEILREQFSLQESINKELQFDYNKLKEKNIRIKSRNTVLFTIGGTILVGIAAALIVKSVL